MSPLTPAEQWAELLAASLPPLTPAEVAAVGHLASVLDARPIPDDTRQKAA